MKLKKFIIIPVLVALVCCFGTVSVFAADDEATETMSPYTVSVKYTDDSSAIKGISYEPYVDPATFAVGYRIVNDLPFGHEIYDDPETPYIDGIRVNGNTVDSLIVIVEEGVTYDIVVRAVYEDNLLGDIAKIIDGKFDFKTLLENPTLLLMAAYYVLAILSVVICTISTLHSKKKKVKTSDEIAAKVTESSDKAVEKVKTEVTETVLAEVSPILQRIFDNIQHVVTALTLSTSKNANAPLAMLDTLQKATSTSDAAALLDNIRKAVSEGIAKDEESRASNIETLREISKNIPTETAETVETVEDTTLTPSNKSVF